MASKRNGNRALANAASGSAKWRFRHALGGAAGTGQPGRATAGGGTDTWQPGKDRQKRGLFPDIRYLSSLGLAADALHTVPKSRHSSSRMRSRNPMSSCRGFINFAVYALHSRELRKMSQEIIIVAVEARCTRPPSHLPRMVGMDELFSIKLKDF